MKRSSTASCSGPQYSSGENGDYEGASIKRSNPTRGKSDAAKYLTTFQAEWSKEWPCITKGSTAHHYRCSICRVERSCAHQGRKDIERHIGSDGHVKKVDAVRSSGKIQKFFNVASSVDKMTALEAKVRRAEVKVTSSMVKHNIPLAFAEHLSPLFREIFPDSEIAKAYGCGKTKTTCILNGVLKAYYQNDVVQQMRDRLFSVSLDGSNDTGRDKMNPITVKVFDVDRVKHKFLDMCTTSGRGAGTAEVIFNNMDTVLQRFSIP